LPGPALRFRSRPRGEATFRDDRKPAPPRWGGLATATARNAGKGERISSKVFVGNLNFDTTSDELQELFAPGDEAVQVVLPTDRMSGRPRGFAFVEFTTEEQAAEAIQKFDGFELAGRKLRVNEATDERRGPGGGFGGGRDFASPPRPGKRPPRPKGSRRNARARKRSIW
jgi:RNA recognition motif-containing protein